MIWRFGRNKGELGIDPDASILVRLAACFAFSTAVYFGGNALAPALGLIWLLTTAPVWGLLLTRPVLESFRRLEGFAAQQALEEWDGQYYRYGSTHIRLYFDEDDKPWVVAKDVLAVLEKKPGRWLERQFDETELASVAGIREKVFSKNGVLTLLSRSSHPETKRFQVWFEREIFGLIERKAAGRRPREHYVG